MRMLRRPAVLDKTGFSDAALDRAEQLSRFPKRVKLGLRAVGWVEAEVDKWLAARVAERDGKAA
jgi:prophage regulatory protein